MTNSQSKSNTEPVEMPTNTATYSNVEPVELDSTANDCIICYESLNANKNICITECGHQFCFSCMMKHVQQNNGCPICRTPIIEYLDSDSEDDEDFEDDEDDLDDDISEITNEETNEPDDYPIEDLVQAFESKGYGLKDALSLLMYKFSKTDPKYSKQYIKQLEADIDNINEELQSEYEERTEMQMNDANVV